MDCVQDIVTLLKDLATILAAVVAAIIAIKGYDSWKKQLRGKAEYELARSLLRSVYSVRDAIQMVRRPIVSGGEIQQAIRETQTEAQELDSTDPRYAALSQEATYAQRWRRLEDRFRDLEVDALEAEVLWGQDIVDAIKPLREYTATLGVSIGLYLQSLQDPVVQPSDVSLREARRIIYQQGQNDRFAEGIQQAVKEVENILKPYLKLT